MSEKVEFNEIEVQALKDLMEVALELKKSGLIGMLKDLSSNTESMMESIEADVSLFRLGLLAGAMLEAARRLDAGKTAGLKMNAEDASYCLLDSLASTGPKEAQPKGLLGLMSAMRDPDIQKGLGYLLAIAKNLGACLKRLEQQP